MLVKIAREVLEKYPQTQIGYVVARIDVKATDEYLEILKGRLTNILSSKNINDKTYASHDQITNWRNVFKDFGLSHKTHRCSAEALIKRTVSGAKMWNISNVVDLYNCCSVLSMIPMGGYDIQKVKGDICIRYGRDDDTFEALGINDQIKVEKNHVVYSDNDKVICWLWNFRDSKHTCIDETTKHAIFFLDAAHSMSHISMQDAVQLFEEGLAKIGATVTSNGILSKEEPQVDISFDNPKKKVVGQIGIFESIQKVKSNTVPIKNLEKKPVVSSSTVSSVKIDFVPIAFEKLTTPQFAIHCAATGNLDSLKEILRIKPSLVDSKDWSGCNLLMHSAVGDHAGLIKYLIENFNGKNKLNEKNRFEETVHEVAKKNKAIKVLEILE